ncbi:nitroreductase/quinone reductase family protein [Streptomonospora nanhaiensis]|uniref:nitroreductase/quinone reductase family protein n=1 Tax=Streptomonospora nanhaiensis TaxID=1323731 RepID=UPI0015CC6BC1|nr:nitroreductase/quinone reductase family protein [Streptomonospora nanhaiensis]MBV2362450.1 nitroreductase family deazaflavin-dependent oxidoreductase [Streptomonospora nanhaiensis]MBX9390777.1 nitroreductase/quinone reductase family protein [Streptomonospora nanhaiensis]
MGNDAGRFRRTRVRRTANAVIGGFISFGLAPSDLRLLTTRGAKSGFLRTTPVSLVENTQGRFLVGAYGETGWVRNLRKDGFGTLRHGGWIELVSVVEVGPERAAPVLREYLDHARAVMVSGQFTAAPDSPDDDFAREAATHPVFEIVRSTTVRL